MPLAGPQSSEDTAEMTREETRSLQCIARALLLRRPRPVMWSRDRGLPGHVNPGVDVTVVTELAQGYGVHKHVTTRVSTLQQRDALQTWCTGCSTFPAVSLHVARVEAPALARH